MGYRGRFAPSPTGDLHLGSAITAIFCAAAARAQGGTLILRIEDLDTARVIPGKMDAILCDLRWLGVVWDEGPSASPPNASDISCGTGPFLQSQRTALYEAALDLLVERGLTYYCDCSRAEIARVVSAPHAGEEGPRYPGACRAFGMRMRPFRRPPAVRLAVPVGVTSSVLVVDRVLGALQENVFETTGDFVLRRGDGAFAYQLAVVVDDLTMGVTEVVRGADLAASAPRQTLLARLLGGEAPQFAHVPLLVGPDGVRLAKRDPRMLLAHYREQARSAGPVVRALLRAYGHDVGNAVDPILRLAEILDFRRLRSWDVVVSPDLQASC
jgi:glutamyl-tRNA synthetase